MTASVEKKPQKGAVCSQEKGWKAGFPGDGYCPGAGCAVRRRTTGPRDNETTGPGSRKQGVGGGVDLRQDGLSDCVTTRFRHNACGGKWRTEEPSLQIMERGLFLLGRDPKIEHRTSNIEGRRSGPRTKARGRRSEVGANAEQGTSNVQHRTSNAEGAGAEEDAILWG
jgi:hypothetical protein